jgi:hypothetical protein
MTILTPSDDAAVNAALDALDNGTIDLTAPTALTPPEFGADDPEADADAPRDDVPTDDDLKGPGTAKMMDQAPESDSPSDDDDLEPDFVPDVDDDADEDNDEPIPVVADATDDDGENVALPGDAVDEGESAGPPPVASPSPPSLDEAMTQLRGKPLTVDEAAGFLRLATNLEQLPPQQAAAIQYLLEGGDPAQLAGGGASPSSASPTAPPPASAEFEPIAIPDYLDDETKAIFQAQNAQMQRLAERQAQIDAQNQQTANAYQQQQYDAENARIAAAAIQARDRFQTDMKLTATDMAVVQAKSVGSPLMHHYMTQYGGDADKAAYDVFRHTLADLPDIAAKVTTNQVAESAQRVRKDSKRKSKASRVSGAASAPPRVPKGATKKDREQAAIADIKAMTGMGD